MKLLHAVILVIGFALGAPARAEQISIAAAADLKPCLDDIVAVFKKEHGGSTIEVTYGSSGNFATQIREGAPFDLYFSADIDYPRQLQKDGLTASDTIPYAVGRIVIWSAAVDASKLTLEDLARSDIGKVAIANPQHAPYGKRAEEALRASGVWEKIQSKLVLGENIAQTAQFVQSGNAQVGIIALSLARSPALADKGRYYLIPDTLHKPLQQAFVIAKHGASNPLAKAFAEFVSTPQSRAIMMKYGFALPNES
jgi:molybdate transport system substrate-binding protein